MALFEFWIADDGSQMVLVPESMSERVADWTRPTYTRSFALDATTPSEARAAVERRMGWRPPPTP